MNNELKKLKKEYKSIVEKYLGKIETERLINHVFSGYSTDEVKDSSIFNYTDSFKLRSAVDRIITHTEKKLTKKKHLQLLLCLAKLSLNRGELCLSSDIYSQVLLRTTKQEKLQIEATESLRGLGEVASHQAKWNESFSYVRKAKKISEKLNDNYGIASCENLLGSFYAERGIIDSAKIMFESGLARLKGKSKRNLDARILVNLGILNNIIGNTKEAESNYRKALSKFKKANDNKRIANTIHNLGMLFTKLGKYKSALKEFSISVEVSKKDKNYLTLAISYLGMAYIYAEQNNLEIATEHIELATKISDKTNDRLTIADAYKVKGIVERKYKHYDSSENYLLTSLRVNGELGNKLNYAETSVELGLLYKDLNQTKKSSMYLSSALKYFKKINSKLDIQNIDAILNMT